MTEAIPLSERNEPKPLRLFIRGRGRPKRKEECCADCGERLKLSEEDYCQSCGDDLCDFCWRWQNGFCLSCPSETEEHGADWWRALMENGDVELSILR